ncbi:MAG: 50S ribosomal protein L17 [Candidatus Latescibacteria bacterium]|nr:50S ribosomal protein L17 [bacterium]MCB9512967.1 50S ribosomal protein L17 [Candidatus Latescibacterota bacterium]MCB9516372.1 50S ribosomal protein L17 [Candidatus Latescibacterota bacterium]
MRHQVRGNRLNRPADQSRAMLRNMVTSLFEHERIETTLTKAKEARRYAERMITFAKRGDLTARRQAARFIIKPVVLQKLFDAIGPRFAERPGGYTRIMRAGIRKGDDAQMAILELVDSNYKPKGKKSGKTDVSKKEADAKRKKDMKKTAAQPPA